MFDKILVANRGEIACRVLRTCARLGARTVAVHSSADRRAPHVAAADEAVRVGASPAAESYLDAAAIIEAALRTGARAIHPGYGFLSENAAFAAACAEAGLVFVGPSPRAIRVMGAKAEARRIVAAAGVPVLPGGSGDDEALAAAARAAGFPVMVKPELGGGGRGLRVARSEDELGPALAAARREAAASFGDGGLLVEKHVEAPRHVEVQVFGDHRGGLVHLFERDCSVQRRHQKVVEEAPAPGLDDAARRRLGEAAVAAARAAGYAGAGTVEFLMDADGRWWFIEMNARLQVEHPVTEMIAGVDLVEWQLRIAYGEPLPSAQDDLRVDGHAIEARLYAEDPADGFRPGTGRLAHLFLPGGDGDLRIDSGVREGDEITSWYDPMIAKIIARGRDREAARARLSRALGEIRIAGPATNEAFLKAVVDHPEFRAGGVDAGFVGRRMNELAPPASAPPDHVAALAALAVLTPRRPAGSSPWADADGWRLGGTGGRRVVLAAGGRRRAFAKRPGRGLEQEDGGAAASDGAWTPGGTFSAVAGGRRRDAVVVRDGVRLTVFADGRRHVLELDDPLAARRGAAGDGGTLAARMPGVVAAVNVAPGQEVAAGEVLIVVEAMKVEHAVRAPAAGRVTEVRFEPGDRVTEGDELVGFEAAPPGG